MICTEAIESLVTEYQNEANPSQRQRTFDAVYRMSIGAMNKLGHKFPYIFADRDRFASEANLALWEAAEKFNGDGEFEKFALMVLNRRLLSQVKYDCKKKRHPGRRVELGECDPAARFAADTDLREFLEFVAAPRDGQKQRGRGFIWRDGSTPCLSELELKAFVAFHIDGKSYAEIAAELAIDEKSCGNAISRSKPKLAILWHEFTSRN